MRLHPPEKSRNPTITQVATERAETLRAFTSSPYEAASRLGVRVLVRDDLPAGIDGITIKRASEDEARIYLRGSLSDRVRREQCAHQLGHFIACAADLGREEFSFACPKRS